MWNVPKEFEFAYREACANAAEDPVLFKCFRRLRSIRAIIDNVSIDEGEQIRQAIQVVRPEYLTTHQKKLEWVDGIGDPPKATDLSPTFLRYIFRVAEIYKQFGSLDGMHIVEVGGGYGGLAAVIHVLFKPASYTLYDLPEVRSLGSRYLCERKIRFIYYGYVAPPIERNDDYFNNKSYDLCISDNALAELDSGGRQEYATNVLPSCRHGSVVWSRHQLENSKDPLSVDEATRWLGWAIAPAKSERVEELWVPTETASFTQGHKTPFFQRVNEALGVDWGRNHIYWKREKQR